MSTPKDEDAYVPIIDQRVFGAGIKRKRIDFVPATTTQHELNTTTSLISTQPSTAVGNHYLSIVLPGANPTTTASSITTSSPLCPICKQPVQATGAPSPSPAPTDATTPTPTPTLHESSIAHQLCLAHSHPPSHLPRAHIGVKYLTSYGWDVDGREGLGARGEGIRIPIKVQEKRNTAGLMERADDEEKGERVRKRKEKEKDKRMDKPVVLDAKALKRRDLQERERMDRLRRSFYGPDLEKYLGPDG
ncbi:hypothetical protein LTR84_006950 [Exophiala bonariae]|uniref:G-patch domain-containing protein n=1 Tax=Exophiala bonariae TaxID=1690606 RepID=A0AAV9MZB3_9EURO|nr:hypothetical protein LTR84_006950 [Exophiala bonariae]